MKLGGHEDCGQPEKIKIYGNFKASKGYSNNMLL
jgi:hypothetical protein